MKARPTWKSVSTKSIRLFASMACIWVAANFFHANVKYYRAGASLVEEAKNLQLREPGLFRDDAVYKFAVSGNSKTLSGFRPDVFEKLFECKVDAYNIGFPGDSEFLSKLHAMTKAGNIPTHVLITQDWQDDIEEPGALSWIHDNKFIVNAMIPWQESPRDFTLFAFECLRKRSIKNVYLSNKREVEKVLLNRGYYFIKSQSHFKNDQLPDDFKLASDSPSHRKPRLKSKLSWVFKELVRMQQEYDFTVVAIPTYYRIGEYASAEADTRLIEQEVEMKNFYSGELDYVLYPPNHFADPVHLNPLGAEVWTKDIGKWVQATMADYDAL